ncbi:PfkB family carbohydrate kinase [Candidatus Poribacteria bacterium]
MSHKSYIAEISTDQDITSDIIQKLEQDRATPDIVVIGDVNFDYVKIIDRDPVWDDEVFITKEGRVPAGSCGIYVAGAGRLGSEVTFVSKVGDDKDGDDLVSFLSERGVDVENIQKVTGGKTAYTEILQPEGRLQRIIVTNRGVLDQLTSADVLPLRGKSLLHTSAYFLLRNLQDSVPVIFEQALSANVAVSFDPNGIEKDRIADLAQNVLPKVDRLYMNRDEMAALSGHDDVGKAIDHFSSITRNDSLVVIKLGSEGVHAGYRGRIIHVDAFPCCNIKDAVGAGDTFDATCNHYLEQGLSLDYALILASANAMASLNEHGGPLGQKDEEGLKKVLSDYLIVKSSSKNVEEYTVIPKIKALLFDLDGLLADSEKLHHLGQNRMLSELAKNRTEMTAEDLQVTVGMDERETCEYFRTKYGLDCSGEELVDLRRNRVIEAINENGVEKMPGAEESVSYAKLKGWRIGIASSSCDLIVDAILQGIGYTRDDFDVVTTGSGNARKPAPDIYLKAAEELCLDPVHCMALEDSRAGMLSAQAAGMRCIVVASEHTKDQDFSEAFQLVNSLKTVVEDDFYQTKRYYNLGE